MDRWTLHDANDAHRNAQFMILILLTVSLDSTLFYSSILSITFMFERVSVS